MWNERTGDVFAGWIKNINYQSKQTMSQQWTINCKTQPNRDPNTFRPVFVWCVGLNRLPDIGEVRKQTVFDFAMKTRKMILRTVVSLSTFFSVLFPSCLNDFNRRSPLHLTIGKNRIPSRNDSWRNQIKTSPACKEAYVFAAASSGWARQNLMKCKMIN